MSIVAISETLGSLGTQIGLELAQVMSFEYFDREVISKAAEQFGRGVTELQHVTEEKPTFWEHFSDTRRRYATFAEATILELAARGGVVICGRGAVMYLQRVPHALRVRVTAPEAVRVRRICQEQGVTEEAALGLVRQSDRERAARVRFVHHVDWDDVLLYDLVLNTERLHPADAVRVLRETLRLERYRATPAGLAVVRDLSLAARARAELLRDPATAHLHFDIACSEGVLTLRGVIGEPALRPRVQKIVEALPGLRAVQNEIVEVGQRARAVYGP